MDFIVLHYQQRHLSHGSHTSRKPKNVPTFNDLSPIFNDIITPGIPEAGDGKTR